MYDFSEQGRVECMNEYANPDLDGVRYLPSTRVNAKLPWDIDDLLDMNGGYDSLEVGMDIDGESRVHGREQARLRGRVR